MEQLKQEARDLFAVELSDAHIDTFTRYVHELDDWNTRVNLTSITEPDAVRVRHFLDSLSLTKVAALDSSLHVMDVGSGAGFPGMVLAIVYPQLRVTLLDSTGKKIAFLDHLVGALKLDNVRTLHARAEDAGHISHHRARYDLVLARAVARLPALSEYLLPLARVGGRCIAMKGVTAAQEAEDAKRALNILGGRVSRIEPVTLPGVPDPHYLVVIEKLDATPKAYPRQAGTPTRKPLGE
jgi:16S rRNA (guanine527-N7)-methyltransferase